MKTIFIISFFILSITLTNQVIKADTTLTKVFKEIKALCFVRNGYIYIKRNNKIEKLIKGNNPDLSPNGENLAYTHNVNSSGPERLIRIMDLKTRKVIEFKSYQNCIQYGPIWSSNSKLIAFNILLNHKWEIGILDPYDDRCRIISTNYHNSKVLTLCSWAKNNSSILCQDTENIYEIGIDGKLINKFSVLSVFGSPFVSSATKYIFSYDGKNILFDFEYEEDQRLYIYNLERNKSIQISPRNFNCSQPKWFSKDEILFTGCNKKACASTFGIYIFNLQTKQVIKLVSNGYYPTYYKD